MSRLLGGRLLLAQPRRGHRAGTDAVLLAATVPAGAATVLADVGAGVGAVGLAVALRAPHATVHLIEKDGPTAALAVRNAALNGLASRVEVHAADLFDRGACAPVQGRMHAAVSNPPFYLYGRTRPSREPGRVGAHVLPRDAGGHGAWLRAMLSLLAPHGAAVLIHRPDALPELLAAAENRLGSVAVRPIHARDGAPAIRMLFTGVAGSRAPLRLDPPLILHGPGGRFTPAVEALHRGEALIEMVTRKSRPRRPASWVMSGGPPQQTRTRWGP